MYSPWIVLLVNQSCRSDPLRKPTSQSATPTLCSTKKHDLHTGKNQAQQSTSRFQKTILSSFQSFSFLVHFFLFEQLLRSGALREVHGAHWDETSTSGHWRNSSSPPPPFFTPPPFESWFSLQKKTKKMCFGWFFLCFLLFF